ncbi:hypothetical protein K402DRAFT_402263 [Aulographum hederae CBS 113979]|uniref:Uncharacterized protein n=1 Tax=Aulographum hederae CBS 113979 TaxID=1176131 RepID=A0A6G1H795_9PEZI|nr:hypothetical protein K402DRAFT_402263 [Aulographum hederae CBS 113979]
MESRPISDCSESAAWIDPEFDETSDDLGDFIDSYISSWELPTVETYSLFPPPQAAKKYRREVAMHMPASPGGLRRTSTVRRSVRGRPISPVLGRKDQSHVDHRAKTLADDDNTESGAPQPADQPPSRFSFDDDLSDGEAKQMKPSALSVNPLRPFSHRGRDSTLRLAIPTSKASSITSPNRTPETSAKTPTSSARRSKSPWRTTASGFLNRRKSDFNAPTELQGGKYIKVGDTQRVGAKIRPVNSVDFQGIQKTPIGTRYMPENEKEDFVFKNMTSWPEQDAKDIIAEEPQNAAWEKECAVGPSPIGHPAQRLNNHNRIDSMGCDSTTSDNSTNTSSINESVSQPSTAPSTPCSSSVPSYYRASSDSSYTQSPLPSPNFKKANQSTVSLPESETPDIVSSTNAMTASPMNRALSKNTISSVGTNHTRRPSTSHVPHKVSLGLACDLDDMETHLTRLDDSRFQSQRFIRPEKRASKIHAQIQPKNPARFSTSAATDLKSVHERLSKLDDGRMLQRFSLRKAVIQEDDEIEESLADFLGSASPTKMETRQQPEPTLLTAKSKRQSDFGLSAPSKPRRMSFQGFRVSSLFSGRNTA